MPPKKSAPAGSSSVSSGVSEKSEQNDSAPVSSVSSRKVSPHPATVTMLKEALEQLDSRKGVSAQAVRNWITQKYPTVDVVRLKYMVRKALLKGLASGLLVRPANSSATTGAQGKFRLAPKKAKAPKQKAENTDPNVEKVPKAAKTGAKKSKEAEKETGTTKKKAKKSADSDEPTKEVKAAKGAATSKTAPVKKQKTKKAVDEDVSGLAKPKAKVVKAVTGDKAVPAKAPATKAAGKRGKTTE